MERVDYIMRGLDGRTHQQVYLKDSSTEGTFDDWLTYYNPEKTLAEYFFEAEKSRRTPPNITIFLMTGKGSFNNYVIEFRGVRVSNR